MTRRVPAILLLFGLVVPGGATPSDESGNEYEGVDNPHDDPEGCLACHTAGKTPELPASTLPIVETCRGCHPTADMHPVDIAPQEVTVASGWPLEDGQVTCATCHSEPAHGGDFAELPSPWHRGGPYKRITEFCYQCHELHDYTRNDPHHPEAPRSPTDPTCSACHSTLPETGAAPAESNLRWDDTDACVVCHIGEVHYGVGMHVGNRVPEDVQATLPPSIALHDGDVTCWSCHEVHDGVSTGKLGGRMGKAMREAALKSKWKDVEEDAMWPGTSAAEHPPLLALELENGALCRACHGDGP
ncbi:MAG: hypothetical protein JRI25_11200 [Deltaproteobacteria bacterium]|nr:hypothetical protein [Deltaproteobacteria bacterium]